MSKYKYYFRKPRSEIVKDVFYWLGFAGVAFVAAGSPYFAMNLWRSDKKWQKYPKRKLYTTFYRLQKEGCLEIKLIDNQFYISLTEKGRKKAGRFQIDSLKINKPKKWDKKWRIVMFDISQLKKIYRETFRGKLKDLGFYSLQKSIWVHPFNCRDEIELLKEFFGLSEKEVRLIVAEDIGEDDFLKKIFKLN